MAAAAEATSRPLSGLHEPTGMPCGSRQLQWLSCPGSPGMAPGHRAGAHGKSGTTTPSSASSSLKGCCTRERQPVIMLMRSGQDSTWAISMYRKGTRTGGGQGYFCEMGKSGKGRLGNVRERRTRWVWYIGTKEEEGHKHSCAESSEHCCGGVGRGGVSVESGTVRLT